MPFSVTAVITVVGPAVDGTACYDDPVAIEAVLFDLDETLLRNMGMPDWEAVTALQAKELAPHCERLGFGHLDLAEMVDRFWAGFATAVPEPSWRAGGPLEALALPAGPIVMRETLTRHGVACADEAAATLWEALNAIPESAFNNHLFPDAAATVGALASAGYRLAVVTTRPDSPPALAWRLGEMGLPEVFEAVITGGEVGYRKPHPMVFESALRRLGMEAAQAVFVGDNYEHDIVPAASLGMAAVLKLNEREPDARWELARHQVSSLAALLELELLRLPTTRNPG